MSYTEGQFREMDAAWSEREDRLAEIHTRQIELRAQWAAWRAAKPALPSTLAPVKELIVAFLKSRPQGAANRSALLRAVPAAEGYMERCLRALVTKGVLTKPRRGLYQLVAAPSAPKETV